MTKATQEAYEAAIAGMTADDMTAKGPPKMKPLNAALADAGFDAVTKDELAAFAKADQGGDDDTTEADAEEAPSGKISLTLLAANCDPLPLHIHGVGTFSLRIGVEQELPIEALDALHNCGGVEYSYEEIS